MECLSPLSDSPATLESNLSPAELVPFQGCVLPLLTTERSFSSGPDLVHCSTGAGLPCVQDGAHWQAIAQYQGGALGDHIEVNNQVNPPRSANEQNFNIFIY